MAEQDLEKASLAALMPWPQFGKPSAGHGEGTRGGHVIGHTRSGKAIYAAGTHATSDFSQEDRHEAADAHEQYAAKLRRRIEQHKDKAGMPVSAFSAEAGRHHDPQVRELVAQHSKEMAAAGAHRTAARAMNSPGQLMQSRDAAESQMNGGLDEQVEAYLAKAESMGNSPFGKRSEEDPPEEGMEKPGAAEKPPMPGQPPVAGKPGAPGKPPFGAKPAMGGKPGEAEAPGKPPMPGAAPGAEGAAGGAVGKLPPPSIHEDQAGLQAALSKISHLGEKGFRSLHPGTQQELLQDGYIDPQGNLTAQGHKELTAYFAAHASNPNLGPAAQQKAAQRHASHTEAASHEGEGHPAVHAAWQQHQINLKSGGGMAQPGQTPPTPGMPPAMAGARPPMGGPAMAPGMAPPRPPMPQGAPQMGGQASRPFPAPGTPPGQPGLQPGMPPRPPMAAGVPVSPHGMSQQQAAAPGQPGDASMGQHLPAQVRQGGPVPPAHAMPLAPGKGAPPNAMPGKPAMPAKPNPFQKSMRGLDDLGDYLEKAFGDERAGHKYIRRVGVSGNYQYVYAHPQGHEYQVNQREHSRIQSAQRREAQGSLPGMGTPGQVNESGRRVSTEEEVYGRKLSPEQKEEADRGADATWKLQHPESEKLAEKPVISQVSKYINAIKNPHKKDYAQAYSKWMAAGEPAGQEPAEPKELGYMARQAVRLHLGNLKSPRETMTGVSGSIQTPKSAEKPKYGQALNSPSYDDIEAFTHGSKLRFLTGNLKGVEFTRHNSEWHGDGEVYDDTSMAARVFGNQVFATLPSKASEKPAEKAIDHGAEAERHRKLAQDAYGYHQQLREEGAKPADPSRQRYGLKAQYHSAMQDHHIAMQDGDAAFAKERKGHADQHKAEMDALPKREPVNDASKGRRFLDVKHVDIQSHGDHYTVHPPAEYMGHAVTKQKFNTSAEAQDAAQDIFRNATVSVTQHTGFGEKPAASAEPSKRQPVNAAAAEHNQTAHFLQNLGNLGTHVQKFPSGRHGFVGSVPANLRYERKDGQPLTAEDAKGIAQHGPALFPHIRSRSFATQEEALEAARKMGAHVHNDPRNAAPVSAPPATKPGKAPKGPKTVKVHLHGMEPEELPVKHAVGNLAVHKNRQGTEYTVTHIPSGKRVGGEKKLADAKAFANHMHANVPNALNDLKFGEYPDKRHDAEVRKMYEATKTFKKSLEGLDDLGDYLRKSEKLAGGLADGKSPGDFNAKELARGMKVEREHSTDPKVQREIAQDHLTEDPMYYQKLARMEGEHTTEKCMSKSGLDGLGEYLAKADGMPDKGDWDEIDKPAEQELGGSANGGDLTDTPDGGSQGGSGAGEGQDKRGQITGAPQGEVDTFGDDRPAEQQMTPGRSALEEAMPGDKQGPEGFKSLTPAGQRDMVAKEHAMKVRELQKSDDVRVGGDRHPYSMQGTHDDTDAAASALVKSEFYQGGQPTLAPPGAIIRQTVLCKSDGCGCRYPALLTSCPSCGDGMVKSRMLPQGAFVGGGSESAVRLEKAVFDPIIKPARVEADVHIPGPSPVVVRRRGR